MLDFFIRKDYMLVTYRHPNARRGLSAWFDRSSLVWGMVCENMLSRSFSCYTQLLSILLSDVLLRH